MGHSCLLDRDHLIYRNLTTFYYGTYCFRKRTVPSFSDRQRRNVKITQSDCALAKASFTYEGNLNLSWLVNVVKSIVCCRSCATRTRFVPSLTANLPLMSRSISLVLLTIAHINRLGMMFPIGWECEENLVTKLRMRAALPLTSIGRTPTFLMD